MSFNFILLLVTATALSGVIWLIDALFFAKPRLQRFSANSTNQPVKLPWLVECARSFFPIFLAVLIIRSFIIQPFRVPSGSLEPTILPGDMIIVSQFAYGLHLPILNTKILSLGEPKRGDIVVFHWPADPLHIDFVKRVIGLPGDHIVYKNKVLYINGQEATQQTSGGAIDIEPTGNVLAQKLTENLQGVTHDILIRPYRGEDADYDLMVPSGKYFMMGDNRDDSADSRYWGFVSENDLIGKAVIILMSWDSQAHRIRWHRIGTLL